MKRILLFLFCSTAAFSNHIGEDNNRFALTLFSKMDALDENSAFSPYSLFMNLSLLYGGAEGQTAKEIRSLLHIDGKNDSFFRALKKHAEDLRGSGDNGYQMNIANALFAHQGTHILKNYQTLAKEIFGARVEPVDFTKPDSALETINGWIVEETMGKIPKLVTETDIDDSTRLILTNAVYFEGQWTHPFKEKKTGTFHLNENQSTEALFLEQNSPLPYYENDAIECLALPFIRAGHNKPYLECILVLPKNRSISALESNLNPQTLNTWIHNLELASVDAKIPKFCFSQKMRLDPLLKSLGMKEAFTYQANFSGIDGIRDLYLDRVLHETYFSFHEDGVTAAAATSSHMGVTSVLQRPEKKASFIADHPFLFFLVDVHSRAILFMGRVSDPSKGGCFED